MNKFGLILTFLTLVSTLIFPNWVFAQENNHTASEEAKGRVIQERLLNKQVNCESLSDEDFAGLGEFYMGQMTGTSHEQMNQMMEQMMGQEGEEQMHIVMGKRLSGCDTTAQVPPQGTGFMPMMWMMGPWGMMGGWSGFSIFGWLSMILFWILLIVGLVVLIRYLSQPSRGAEKEKTALDILKERYAKGEIDKNEFEAKKKDLG